MSLLVRRNIELSAEVVVESNNGPMTTWMVTMADASGLLPRDPSQAFEGFLGGWFLTWEPSRCLLE